MAYHPVGRRNGFRERKRLFSKELVEQLAGYLCCTLATLAGPNPAPEVKSPSTPKNVLDSGVRQDDDQADLALVEIFSDEPDEKGLVVRQSLEWDSGERALLESSLNSVRISLVCRPQPAITGYRNEVLATLSSQLQLGDIDSIIRRVPLPGFDISFLFTKSQLVAQGRAELVAKFIGVLQGLDREIENIREIEFGLRRRISKSLLLTLLESQIPARPSVKTSEMGQQSPSQRE